jgi:hypothetical protein
VQQQQQQPMQRLLVEFVKGPAADVFSFRKLWYAIRKSLEEEVSALSSKNI